MCDVTLCSSDLDVCTLTLAVLSLPSEGIYGGLTSAAPLYCRFDPPTHMERAINEVTREY